MRTSIFRVKRTYAFAQRSVWCACLTTWPFTRMRVLFLKMFCEFIHIIIINPWARGAHVVVWCAGIRARAHALPAWPSWKFPGIFEFVLSLIFFLWLSHEIKISKVWGLIFEQNSYTSPDIGIDLRLMLRKMCEISFGYASKTIQMIHIRSLKWFWINFAKSL